MQYNIFPAFFIFLGSYLPLAFILAVQDIPNETWSYSFCDISILEDCNLLLFENPIMVFSVLIITLTATVLGWLSIKLQNFPQTITISNCKPIPNDIINYVFPYVVSFMGISYNEPSKLIGFFVFLVWMFAITYKSGQILMNPLLLMFGWKLYEGKTKNGDSELEIRILHLGKLNTGCVKVQKIQDIYIARSLDDS
jgi:hypothetical protein